MRAEPSSSGPSHADDNVDHEEDDRRRGRREMGKEEASERERQPALRPRRARFDAELQEIIESLESLASASFEELLHLRTNTLLLLSERATREKKVERP